MGNVTVILLHRWMEDITRCLPEINRRLGAESIGALADLTEAWSNVEQRGWRRGGTKHPEADVFGAAYARLDLNRFMRIVLEAPWEYPGDLQ